MEKQQDGGWKARLYWTGFSQGASPGRDAEDRVGQTSLLRQEGGKAGWQCQGVLGRKAKSKQASCERGEWRGKALSM